MSRQLAKFVGHTDGRPVYVTSAGGVTGGGCGWAVSLLDTDCLIASTSGADDLILSTSDGLTWTGSSLAICSTNYYVSFTKGDCNGPCLTLAAGGSGGTVYSGVRTSCGCNYAVFSFSKRALCPSTERSTTGGPCSDVVDVRVDWSRCPITGWEGEGWYCVVDADGDCGDAVALNLVGDDQYDTDIKICSGVYASQALAEAECGAVTDITIDCSGTSYTIKSVVWARFGGVLAGLGTVKLVYDGSYWVASSLPTGCGTLTGMDWRPCGFGLGITGATSTFTGLYSSNVGCTISTCEFTTSPLMFKGIGTVSGTCSGDASVEITETP